MKRGGGFIALTPTYSTVEIGHSSSSLGESEHTTATWRKSHKTVSSIFKPRRTIAVSASRDYPSGGSGANKMVKLTLLFGNN